MGVVRERDWLNYMLFVTLFPAPDRRPDPSPSRDHAAIRGPADLSAERRERRDRLQHVHLRTVQEGSDRRSDRRFRAAGIRPLVLGRPGRGLDRCARLRRAALFRFLRLLGHGDRAGPDVRGSLSAQFQFALQGREHSRLLAALAHDADALAHLVHIPTDPAADHAAPLRPRRRPLPQGIAGRVSVPHHGGVSANGHDGVCRRLARSRAAVSVFRTVARFLSFGTARGTRSTARRRVLRCRGAGIAGRCWRARAPCC